MLGVPLKARMPLDVDLEDRLIYGLTPIHFGELLLGALAAFAVWRSGLPGVPRSAMTGLLLLVGVSLGWGGWRGRAFDGWVLDAVEYVRANYRLEIRPEAAAATAGVRGRLAARLHVRELEAAITARVTAWTDAMRARLPPWAG